VFVPQKYSFTPCQKKTTIWWAFLSWLLLVGFT
jgi:hypothetical protein